MGYYIYFDTKRIKYTKNLPNISVNNTVRIRVVPIRTHRSARHCSLTASLAALVLWARILALQIQSLSTLRDMACSVALKSAQPSTATEKHGSKRKVRLSRHQRAVQYRLAALLWYFATRRHTPRVCGYDVSAVALKSKVFIFTSFFLTFLSRATIEKGSRALLSLWPPFVIFA